MEAEGSSRPSDYEFFSIREYVAEVRQRDWKKCYPFNLSGDSNVEAYKNVVFSLLQEDSAATLEDAQVPNSSGVRNSGVQEAETHMVITRQDARASENDGASGSAAGELRDSQCQRSAEDDLAHKRKSNFVRRKPQKFRLLSDIYKELGGPGDSHEFNTETGEESDIRERSPPSDDEYMAALQLLRLSNAG